MKIKYLAAIFLALSLFTILALAGQGMGPGPGVKAYSGGGGGSAPTVRNFCTPVGAGSCTIPQPVSGNFIVVFNFNFSGSTPTTTDSAGNTYTNRVNAGDANGNFCQVSTAPVTATGSGTLTVTENLGGVIVAIELTGNVSSTPIDGSVTSGTFSGSVGGTLTATGIITTVANDILLSGAIDQNGAALTVNTGTLIYSGTLADRNIVQKRTVAATGTYAEAFNVPVSVGETAVICAIAIKGT